MATKRTTKRRTKKELDKLKSWAKTLITKEGHTQLSAADVVGISTTTMNKWYNDGKWQELERNILLTRSEQLAKLYKELENFNSYIETKPVGQQFADSKEGDARSKLMKNIEQFEEDASLPEIIHSCQSLLEFIRKVNLADAQLLSKYADNFIKSRL
jgi:hypothetical protein